MRRVIAQVRVDIVREMEFDIRPNRQSVRINRCRTRLEKGIGDIETFARFDSAIAGNCFPDHAPRCFNIDAVKVSIHPARCTEAKHSLNRCQSQNRLKP